MICFRHFELVLAIQNKRKIIAKACAVVVPRISPLKAVNATIPNIILNRACDIPNTILQIAKEENCSYLLHKLYEIVYME